MSRETLIFPFKKFKAQFPKGNFTTYFFSLRNWEHSDINRKGVEGEGQHTSLMRPAAEDTTQCDLLSLSKDPPI